MTEIRVAPDVRDECTLHHIKVKCLVVIVNLIYIKEIGCRVLAEFFFFFVASSIIIEF